MVVDRGLVLGTVLLLQLHQQAFTVEGELTVQIQLRSTNVAVEPVSEHPIPMSPLQEIERRFLSLLHETIHPVPTVYIAAKASSPPIDCAT